MKRIVFVVLALLLVNDKFFALCNCFSHENPSALCDCSVKSFQKAEQVGDPSPMGYMRKLLFCYCASAWEQCCVYETCGWDSWCYPSCLICYTEEERELFYPCEGPARESALSCTLIWAL